MRNTRDVITLQTLENFSDSELGGTLIGRVDGSGQERRSACVLLRKAFGPTVLRPRAWLL